MEPNEKKHRETPDLPPKSAKEKFYDKIPLSLRQVDLLIALVVVVVIVTIIVGIMR